MSRNQQHGKLIEKALGHALTGHPIPDSGTDAWDIPAVLDWRQQLNTSVKSMKADAVLERSIIGMADARRAFSINEPFRMLVAPYVQVGGIKQVHLVFEFFIQPHEMEQLYGQMTYEDVEGFHEGLLDFGSGHHVAARSWAKSQKSDMADLSSRFVLNPKIDSKTQRRLQCSLRLGTLIEVVGDRTIHEGQFYGLHLPLLIDSSQRDMSGILAEDRLAHQL